MLVTGKLFDSLPGEKLNHNFVSADLMAQLFLVLISFLSSQKIKNDFVRIYILRLLIMKILIKAISTLKPKEVYDYSIDRY